MTGPTTRKALAICADCGHKFHHTFIWPSNKIVPRTISPTKRRGGVWGKQYENAVIYTPCPECGQIETVAVERAFK